MMRNLSCIYSLGILKPGCTGVLTEQFAPGAGELMFFNTWSVLNSPLYPGGGGPWFQMTEALYTVVFPVIGNAPYPKSVEFSVK
jgi:hypothetical protein